MQLNKSEYQILLIMNATNHREFISDIFNAQRNDKENRTYGRLMFFFLYADILKKQKANLARNETIFNDFFSSFLRFY